MDEAMVRPYHLQAQDSLKKYFDNRHLLLRLHAQQRQVRTIGLEMLIQCRDKSPIGITDKDQ